MQHFGGKVGFSGPTFGFRAAARLSLGLGQSYAHPWKAEYQGYSLVPSKGSDKAS